jgi:hypothetical protein
MDFYTSTDSSATPENKALNYLYGGKISQNIDLILIQH